MTGVKSLVTLVTLVSLLGVAVNGQLPDITVSSTYKSNQILPCSFPSGDDLLVHWYKERKDLAVHSYYHGQDQLDHQMDQFRGRTSLFHEQLSRGNASLLLKEVQVSDRGRYTCYTSKSRGRQESSVNLEVEAPVTKVSIVQEGDNITCSSEGIYPEPQVTWSRNKTADTRIEKTEQLLYNIRSSVRVDDEGDYTCHVRSNRSSRSATLTTARITNTLEFEITLDSPALKSPLTSVTWRFNGSIIVQREVYVIVTEGWRDHANILHPSGSLTLQNLSPDLSGIYTCEVTNEEETHVKITHVKIAGRLEKTLLFLFIFSMSMLALFLLRFCLISLLQDRDDETKDQLQVLPAKRRKRRRRPRRKKATAGGSHVPQSDQVSKDLKETGF
ncbi:V-set domain-containing T-cell activation inhibitor 1-like isoform X2 [Synchiropus splendidus]|uniref:V-set domain-containing T-cell activation inhibitor 1-like isoform X2 n=1 Tax=Synchiropus splendidus TaxID=270530 RepID=UPI00237D3D84|nr:V-set domain-containing T-cell activation inhibitor 1-like isoform X2 [Synchiropus splendidus]